MTNLDEAEVAKFDAMASRWWDPDGDMRPLHAINPLRTGYVAEAAQLSGADCLDVGCGGGLLTEELAKLGGKVTGIDASEAALTVARLHATMTGVDVDYQCITAEAFADRHLDQPQDGTHGARPEFDVVTCMELLEHVPDPASLVAACARLARPGGKVFFSTINRNLKAYLLAIVGAEHVLRMLPRGTHDYEKFIRPSELVNLGRAAGLELEDIRGIRFNPLAGGFELCRDAGVNYLMRFRRP